MTLLLNRSEKPEKKKRKSKKLLRTNLLRLVVVLEAVGAVMITALNNVLENVAKNAPLPALEDARILALKVVLELVKQDAMVLVLHLVVTGVHEDVLLVVAVKQLEKLVADTLIMVLTL